MDTAETATIVSRRDTIMIYGSSAVTENGRFPSGTQFKGTAACHMNEKVAVGPEKLEERSRVGGFQT